MCKLRYAAWSASLLVCLLTSGAQAAELLFEEGSLQRGDRRLANDEYYDEFTFAGLAGQRILIELTSGDFDTYLMLSFPGGETIENDDCGNTQNSFLRAALPEDGTYTVTVTSLNPSEVGNYQMIAVSDDSAFASVQGGILEQGDATLENGEYYDSYSVQGAAGQRIELRLGSDDFNTYLMLESPDGSVISNDPEESNNSAIRSLLPASGEYLVHVTSSQPRETGEYRLVIDQIDVRGSIQKGRLQSGDEQLEEGEYYDTYTIDGTQGEMLDILLVSADFDPYVVIVTPNGEQWETDDLEVGSTPAGIRMTLPQSGQYDIWVTSYAAGEVGQYYLSIGRE